ncbi:MAG: VWA domain-containing protein [Gemmataceae bacterium]
MPLFAFFFGTPLAAAAAIAGAAAIPIVIHLLNRKRFKVVTWAAMRFLLNAHKKNTRRLRLEQMVLLAVRTAMILLLVLAMASVMPWAEGWWHKIFPESMAFAASSGQRTHKILVLDGSFSMATKAGDVSYFEKARDLAEQIVQDSPRGHGFSVVLMSSPARRIVSEASEDTKKVLAEIESVRLPHGNADLPGTLATIEDLLRQSPTKFEDHEVYFLTDMQQASWSVRQPVGVAALIQKIQSRARTILVDVGKEGVSNTAITNLTLGTPLVGTSGATPIKVTIHHFGNEARDATPIELWIGKAAAKTSDKHFKEDFRLAYQETRKLSRGPNTITIPYRFTSPGDYVVQVRIGADALDLDDVRSAVVHVKDEVPVVLVNGKAAIDPWDQGTEWLRIALNPFEGKPAPGQVAVKPKVLTESQFADASAGDLSNCDCVFLCDVPHVSLLEARRLEAHLRSGGGVVVCLGNNVDLGSYNEVLYRGGSGLLPARLLAKQEASDPFHFQFSLEGKSELEPPLDAFSDERDRASLLQARFSTYIRTELAKSGGARKVLSFVPTGDKAGSKAVGQKLPVGDAAIVEWHPPLAKNSETRGSNSAHSRGRVLLVTSTVNSDWNNWPATRGYLPLMQELLRYAVAGRLREQNFTVGEPIEEYLQGTMAALSVEMHTPERLDSFKTQALDEASVLRWTDTELSGLYRATIGQDPHEYLYAVNVPSSGDAQQAGESDPTRTSAEDLQRSFPEWDIQVVTDLAAIKHTGGLSASAGSDSALRPIGPRIAHWLLLGMLVLLVAEVVLAWRFGHYSSVEGTYDGPSVKTRGRRALSVLLVLLPIPLFALVLAVILVLAHYVWTADFLGFLPDSLRRGFEQAFNIPAPAAGEGSHWRLDFVSYIWDLQTDPWLAVALGFAVATLVVWIYKLEGAQRVRPAVKFILSGLRICYLLLVLMILLPQVSLCFERESWPDIVLLFDDSQSMSTVDAYQDEAAQAAAQDVAQAANLTALERLRLAQALATRPDNDWLATLLRQRHVKIHVYHCSTRAARLADVADESELTNARQAIKELQASSANDSSQLGNAVHQVLNDYRGSSLSAIIMLTDGVTTEGEDLVKASKHAAKIGVPLFLVGLGDSLETKDLRLHDLQVEDTVFVHDNLVFDVRLSGPGYADLTVPVALYEKGKDKPLKTEMIKLEKDGKPKKVAFVHRPEEKGQKTFVIKVPEQSGEAQTDNNVLERDVDVREAKLIKVLYVEGYPRYEFRFIKTLLERESARTKGNKSVDLKVLLTSADSQWVSQDKSAISEFPARAELDQFDVVILGDLDPNGGLKVKEGMKNLADFVRERGGGLLMIAGPRFTPHAYRDSPLRDILPIDIGKGPPEEEPGDGYENGYRPELTFAGRSHPIFRFSSDEQENDAVWSKLKELFWHSKGYQPKRAAEVLAVYPKAIDARSGTGLPIGDPLVLQEFVGSGRSMFFGFDETWRWQFREDRVHFNQFWIQTMRYLAHSRLGRVELRLDRQTPYRRGEPIRITVRFPDDVPPPGPEIAVRVAVERSLTRPGAPPESEVQSVQLAKVEGSRATYEALLTRTPEGDYRMWLSEPALTADKPKAECRVLAPPGEMDQLRMNQTDLEKAAEESHGHFYTLANVKNLFDDLPAGTRMTVNAPGPPLQLWNHWLVFLLVLMIVTTEWILRKRLHLL